MSNNENGDEGSATQSQCQSQSQSQSQAQIQVTADGLIDLRLHHPLARKVELLCPYDHLFWTAAGAELARMAEDLDPVYAQDNIARYRWFTAHMRQAAGTHPQMLILGAGYDTRGLVLPPAGISPPQIFEVDFPEKLAQKRAVLEANGIRLPAHLHLVGADLIDEALLDRLTAAGYRADLPTAIFMEGVIFFLPRPAAEAVLDPHRLRLASGSRLALDYWSLSRQSSLNARVQKRLGRKLFGESPLGETMEEAAAYCSSLGYADIRVTGLKQVCAADGIDLVTDPLGDGWRLLEARLVSST